MLKNSIQVRHILPLLLFFLVVDRAQALMVSKYDIPGIIPAEDFRPALTLQGAAIRDWYLVVKGYIGALYLEKPASTPEEIYASDSYQRMTFVMLVSKMSARRIANAFYDSIQLNSPPEEQEAMKADLDRIFAVVDGSMKQGEQAVFEYLPEQGVRIEIAGEEKAVIPADKEVFNLSLRVWIGDTPPSQEFKKKILGLKSIS